MGSHAETQRRTVDREWRACTGLGQIGSQRWEDSGHKPHPNSEAISNHNRSQRKDASLQWTLIGHANHTEGQAPWQAVDGQQKLRGIWEGFSFFCSLFIYLPFRFFFCLYFMVSNFVFMDFSVCLNGFECVYLLVLFLWHSLSLSLSLPIFCPVLFLFYFYF